MVRVHTSINDALLRVVSEEFILGVRWFGIPTLASIERYREIQARHLRLHAGFKALIISHSDVGSDALHFDSGLRRAVESILQDASSKLLGMAQIISGEGFGVASVRSVLSGMQLAVRPDYPIQLFSDAKSAIPWLEELLLEANYSDLAREVGSQVLAALEPGRPDHS